MPSGSAGFFEAVSGITLFLSMLTIAFCVSSLRSHVDEAKLKKEKNVAELFRAPFPPEHILTETGLRRVRIAKIAVFVLVATTAIVVLKVQVFSR